MFLDYWKIYDNKKNNLTFLENVELIKSRLNKSVEIKFIYNHKLMTYQQIKKICEDNNKVLIIDKENCSYNSKYYGIELNPIDDVRHVRYIYYHVISIPKQRYDFIIKNFEYYYTHSPARPILKSFTMAMIYKEEEVYGCDCKYINYSKIISDYFLHKKKKVMYMWEIELIIDMMLYDYINDKHYSDKVFNKYFRGLYIKDYCPFISKGAKVIDEKSHVLILLKAIDEIMHFSSYMCCLYDIYEYFQKKFTERDTINYYMIILIKNLFHFSIKNLDDKNYLNNITDKREKSVLINFTPDYIQNLYDLFFDENLVGLIGGDEGDISTKSYKEFVKSCLSLYDPDYM